MRKLKNRQFAAAIAVCTALAGALVSAEDRHVTPIPVKSTAATAPATCAVIGDVQFPGPYEFQGSPLNLKELIERAGGIHGLQGRCVIKIVRGGRVIHHGNHNVSHPLRPSPLKAGDIVVVSSGEKAAPPAADKTAHVALVNLLDEPIILPVFDKNITVSQLVRELHQNPALERRIDVIAANETAAAFASRYTSRKLTDGMVLVFDPNSVEFSQLPTIPSVAALPDPAAEEIQLVVRETVETATGPEFPAAPSEPADDETPVFDFSDETPVAKAATETQPDFDAPAGAEYVFDETPADAAEPEIAVAEPTTDADFAVADTRIVIWMPILGGLLILVGLGWMLNDHRDRVLRRLAFLPGISRFAGSVKPAAIPTAATRSEVASPEPAPAETSPMHRAGDLVHRVLFRVQGPAD